jgi:hypothetical protein
MRAAVAGESDRGSKILGTAVVPLAIDVPYFWGCCKAAHANAEGIAVASGRQRSRVGDHVVWVCNCGLLQPGCILRGELPVLYRPLANHQESSWIDGATKKAEGVGGQCIHPLRSLLIL